MSDSIDKVTGAKGSAIIDKYITGVKLKSASRPGDVLPSGNFLAKIGGIKIVPATTEAEEIFTLSHLETFKLQGRSKLAEYDEYTRKFLQPLFEQKSEALRNDKDFQKANLAQKRDIIKYELSLIKKKIRNYASRDFRVGESGEDSGFKLQMKNSALNVPKDIKKEVLEIMKKYGYETDLRKMSVQELYWFLTYTKLRKETIKRTLLN